MPKLASIALGLSIGVTLVCGAGVFQHAQAKDVGDRPRADSNMRRNEIRQKTLTPSATTQEILPPFEPVPQKRKRSKQAK